MTTLLTEEYKNVLSMTIEETYPKYLKKQLLKQLSIKHYVSFNPSLFSESLDLSNVHEDDQLVYSIKNSIKAIEVLEQDELERPYNYSVLFKYETLIDGIIENLITNHSLMNIKSADFKHDILSEQLANSIPTYIEYNDEIAIIKFNLKILGHLAIPGENSRTVKYPILLLLHKNINVLEIRLATIKSPFKDKDEYFYANRISEVLSWIESNLLLTYEDIDLVSLIEKLKKNPENNEVRISAQAMNMQGGKTAVLNTGANEDYILPLLGELNELMSANEQLFLSSPEIKTLLENFIKKTEETSDLPWITLSWLERNQKDITKIKFRFNYSNQNYSLLQYYESNSKMEKMNYVANYLIESQRDAEQNQAPSE